MTQALWRKFSNLISQKTLRILPHGEDTIIEQMKVKKKNMKSLQSSSQMTLIAFQSLKLALMNVKPIFPLKLDFQRK